MRRPCECGHRAAVHIGFFGDCLAHIVEGTALCDCRRFVEAPRFWYLRRMWRWLKAVPV